MTLEQERAQERTRAEARERVRLAQEREARAWQATQRPAMERATLAARHRTARVAPDAAADTQAVAAACVAEASDDTRTGCPQLFPYPAPRAPVCAVHRPPCMRHGPHGAHSADPGAGRHGRAAARTTGAGPRLMTLALPQSR